jgi:hypothetical protein
MWRSDRNVHAYDHPPAPRRRQGDAGQSLCRRLTSGRRSRACLPACWGVRAVRVSLLKKAMDSGTTFSVENWCLLGRPRTRRTLRLSGVQNRAAMDSTGWSLVRVCLGVCQPPRPRAWCGFPRSSVRPCAACALCGGLLCRVALRDVLLGEKKIPPGTEYPWYHAWWEVGWWPCSCDL